MTVMTTTTIPAAAAGTTPSSLLLSHTAHISKLAHAAAIALDRHVQAVAGPAAAAAATAAATASPPDEFAPPPPPPPTPLRPLEDLASQLYVLGLHVDQLALCLLPGGDPSNGPGDGRFKGEDGAARREGRENGSSSDSDSDPDRRRRDNDKDGGDGDGPVLAMLGSVLQACDGAMEVLAGSVAALEKREREAGSGTAEGAGGEAMAAGKECVGKIDDEAVTRYEGMLTANRTAIYIGAQLLGEGHWSSLLRHPQAIKLVGEARRTSREVLDGRWRLVAGGNVKGEQTNREGDERGRSTYPSNAAV